MLNLSAMIVWIVIALSAMFDVVPGGAISTVLYSGFIYYLLEKIFGNKLHIGEVSDA